MTERHAVCTCGHPHSRHQERALGGCFDCACQEYVSSRPLRWLVAAALALLVAGALAPSPAPHPATCVGYAAPWCP